MGLRQLKQLGTNHLEALQETGVKRADTEVRYIGYSVALDALVALGSREFHLHNINKSMTCSFVDFISFNQFNSLSNSMTLAI